MDKPNFCYFPCQFHLQVNLLYDATRSIEILKKKNDPKTQKQKRLCASQSPEYYRGWRTGSGDIFSYFWHLFQGEIWLFISPVFLWDGDSFFFFFFFPFVILFFHLHTPQACHRQMMASLSVYSSAYIQCLFLPFLCTLLLCDSLHC